jgi:hypothetical protein
MVMIDCRILTVHLFGDHNLLTNEVIAACQLLIV